MNEIIQTVAVYALPVIFAITLHEAAHAFAAKYFGDTTAYSQGRMSLNPVKHIDPMGTIVMPLMLYVLTSGAFLFGYAKPVPVNWGNLRKPKRDMAWVALAGPAANFIMAVMWLLFSLALSLMRVDEDFLQQMVRAGVLTNLVIFAFNLLPLPPLDGGRVMFSLLPRQLAWKYAKLEPYGMIILVGLIVLGQVAGIHLLQYWMTPVMRLGEMGLQLVMTPFLFLLKTFL